MLVFKIPSVSRVVFHDSSLFLTFLKFCQLWLDRQSVNLKSDPTALRRKLTLGLNTKLSFASFSSVSLTQHQIRVIVSLAVHWWSDPLISTCSSYVSQFSEVSNGYPLSILFEGHWWHCRSNISPSYPRNLKQLHGDVLFSYLRRFFY